MNTSMFGLDIAFAMELIAAVAGAFLIIYAAEKTGFSKKIGKTVGWSVVSLSVLGMVCTLIYGTAYWQKGIFNADTVSRIVQGQSMAGQRSGMMRGNMMPEGMMGKMRMHTRACTATEPDYQQCLERAMNEMNRMMRDFDEGNGIGH